MYTLTIEIYSKNIKPIVITTNWELGIKQALELSQYAENNKWTRHSSCQSVVHHMDKYFDLYNEGAIKLEPKNK